MGLPDLYDPAKAVPDLEYVVSFIVGYVTEFFDETSCIKRKQNPMPTAKQTPPPSSVTNVFLIPSTDPTAPFAIA